MAELIVKIPDELEERMRAFPTTDWQDIERKTIEYKLFELELKHSVELKRILVEAISSKSELSEEEADKFAVELGRKIKKGRYEKLKTMGVV